METIQPAYTRRTGLAGGHFATQLPRVPVASAIVENEAGGTYRLRLIAADAQEPGTLSRLAQNIRQHGYEHIFADIWEHKHVLVVSHLSHKQTAELTDWLEANGMLASNAVAQHAQPEKNNVGSSLKRDSLKWAGRFAMTGSAAIAAAGVGQKDWNRVFSGLGFMAADGIIAAYGNGKGAIDFDGLFRDMHRHFEHNGIHLAQIASPEARLNSIETVQRFIQTHPVELGYSLGMFGGLSHLRSGMADFSRSGAGISRMVKGTLGAGGSAAVIFLEEDKKKEAGLKRVGHYLRNPLEIPQGVTDFILASPIRFKGYVSAVYSMLYLTDSLEEKKKMQLWAKEKGGLYEGKNAKALQAELQNIASGSQIKALNPHSIQRAADLRKGLTELEHREKLAKTFFGGKVTPYLSAFTALCYISASLLASASSKNRDASYQGGDEYERMYAMAAQTLMGVPKTDRTKALDQIATYLSAQNDIKQGDITVAKITEEVSQRMELMDQSPWLSAERQIQRD